MSDQQSKEQLREQARAHRDKFHKDLEDPEKLTELFFSTIQPKKDQIIAGYWPINSEFDCRYILDDLLKDQYICALPVIQKDSKILKFSQWDALGGLAKNKFDIMEPEDKVYVDPDIILVPLLAFDRHGHRLGYGGGYYDQTIASLKKQKSIVTVGVCYAQQAVLFKLPVDPHDQSLDWVITPSAAHQF